MLKITNILNPLTGGATTKKYKWKKDKSLAKYLKYTGECMVACDGAIVELPVDKIFPATSEHYMVMPIPAGGDKQTWRVIGFMAMGAISMVPGWGPVVALVGSNAINLFLRDDPAKPPSMSESYAWQHTSSPSAYKGTPMPIIYGKARVRPVLKNRYIIIDGDKQRLYA